MMWVDVGAEKRLSFLLRKSEFRSTSAMVGLSAMRNLGSVEFWTIAAGVIALVALLFSFFVYRKDYVRIGKKLVINSVSLSTLTNESVRIDGKPLRVFLAHQAINLQHILRA